jgi:hypothetical protein
MATNTNDLTGRTLIYHEDGFVGTVLVEQDNSNDEWLKYKLKVLEVLRESRMFGSIPVGESFEVLRKLNTGSYSGMWYLEEMR